MMRIAVKLSALALAAAAAASLAARYPGFFTSAENVALAAVALMLLGAFLFQPVGEDGRLVHAGWDRVRRIVSGAALVAALSAAVALAVFERDAVGARAKEVWRALAPNADATRARGAVVLKRDLGGHFTARVRVNGLELNMLVDTGSSDVALPYAAAEKLGVDMSTLVFDNPVMTANGRAMVATLKLATVTVGGITLKNVRASVAEKARLASPLLGMSFLGKLTEVTLRGETLILRK